MNSDSMGIFVSCQFPVSEFTQKIIRIGNAMNMNLFTIGESKTGNIREKIEKAINESIGMLFCLEDRKDDNNNHSDWMTLEYTIGSGLNLPFSVINNSSSKAPEIFPNQAEILTKDKLDDYINIISYIFSLRKKIEDKKIRPFDNLTFLRESIQHCIETKKNGNVIYQTGVKIKCLKEGLNSLSHSIHKNYSKFWSDSDHVPQIEVINENKNRIVDIDTDNATNGKIKYTWDFLFDPCLRANDCCEFGWKTEFAKYFPDISELQDNEKDIRHHFYINHPTQKLEMELIFEDGSHISDFKPLVYHGTCFSESCIDREELDKIKNKLTVNGVNRRKTAKLIVDTPLIGRNYVISWSVKK